MISKAEADEKVKGKWLRVRLVFEVIGVRQDVTEVALKDLLGKLDRDKRVAVYNKEFSDIIKVENPVKNIKEGYSQVCEADLVAKGLENLVGIVIEYGPSAIDVIEPAKIEMPVGEATAVANTVSDMIHRFAAAGIGGLLFVKEKVKE
jgi:hypothetical protein